MVMWGKEEAALAAASGEKEADSYGGFFWGRGPWGLGLGFDWVRTGRVPRVGGESIMKVAYSGGGASPQSESIRSENARQRRVDRGNVGC